MRDFLAFTSIFAVSLTSSVAGFVWWVPVVGTFVLFALSLSRMWWEVRMIHDLGATRGALPIYLKSLFNAAVVMAASVVLGLVTKVVFHF